MSTKLHDLKPPKGARRKAKRVGRGPGSGHGVTAGKGTKGQQSRSGYRRQRGREGGQMPLIRRIPKRGFTNIFRKRWAVINVRDLAVFSKDAEVTPEELRKRRLVPNLRLCEGVKVLGVGKLRTALVVRAHAFSAGARAKIEKAGGRVEVIPVA